MYGGMAYDKGKAIYIDSKDNYYIAGDIQDYYGSEIATNFLAGCVPMETIRKDNVDGFILRYDSSYNLTLKFAIPGRVNSVITDRVGNIIVVGVSEYDYSFDGITLIPNNGDTDGYIAKYDNLGKLIWYRVIKSDQADVISSLDIDKDGNLLICGFSNGLNTFVFDRTIQSFNNFIILLDPNGLIKWTSFLNFNTTIRPVIAKFDLQSNVIYTGSYGDSSISIKVAVGKLNGQNGFSIWNKKWGETGKQYVQQGTAIAIANNGDYVIGGEFSGSAVFDSYTLSAKGYIDIFLTKIDTSGNIKWLKSAGSTEFDKIYDVKCTKEEIYFCGGFSDNFLIGDKVLHAVDYTDIYVAATDAAGNFKWVITAGNFEKGHKNDFNYHEYAAAISIDSKNRLQVVGTTIGSGAFGKIKYLADEKSNQNGYWATISTVEGSGTVRYPCKDITNNVVFDAYPNPFYDRINLSIPGLSRTINTKWKLFDIIGRLYRKGTFSGSDLHIGNLEPLPTGVYIIRITGPLTVSIKMIKKVN